MNHACVQSASCTTLTQLGASVDAYAGNPGTPAPPAGGTIANGKYVLTGLKLYGTPNVPGQKVAVYGKHTIEVTATTVAQITTEPDSAETRMKSTYTKSGTNLVLTRTCTQPGNGSPTAVTLSFSATPTTLTLYEVQATQPVLQTTELIFTKQ